MGQLTQTTRQALWAAVFVVLCGNVTIFAHHYAVHHGASAVGLALVSMASASLLMLSVGGWKLATAKNTLRYPLTWVYAFCRLGTVICMTMGLTYLTPGTMMFLSIVDILFALPLVWLLLGRATSLFDQLCALVLLVGLVGVVGHLDNQWFNMGLWCMLGEGVLNSLMTITMEKHPTWPHGLHWRARSAFTGAVLLATSLVLLAGFIGVALLGVVFPLPEALVNWANPQALLAGLLSPATWVWGIFVGVVIRAPQMLLSFVALRGLKSELYTAMWAVFPLLSWGTEWLLYRLGYWPASPMVGEGLGWGLLMVAALTAMAVAQIRRMVKER